MNHFYESFMRYVFMISAFVCIVAIALICLYLFSNGIPAIKEIGFMDFVFGTKWKPSSDIYGILPMIIGSIYVTVGALSFGVPVGILSAVYLTYFCPKKIYRYAYPLVELLAGIPSVVYGFFGLVVIAPIIANIFDVNGLNILTASLLLGIMILPTIIAITQSSLKALPSSYLEGSLALGATKESSIFFVLIPAAKSGILAAVLLGIGRAIGETMAVVMVAGNQPRIPHDILSGARTLTSNIVLEMGYAADLHKDALIATGVVLFVFILLINSFVSFLGNRRAS